MRLNRNFNVQTRTTRRSGPALDCLKGRKRAAVPYDSAETRSFPRGLAGASRSFQARLPCLQRGWPIGAANCGVGKEGLRRRNAGAWRSGRLSAPFWAAWPAPSAKGSTSRHHQRSRGLPKPSQLSGGSCPRCTVCGSPSTAEGQGVKPLLHKASRRFRKVRYVCTLTPVASGPGFALAVRGNQGVYDALGTPARTLIIIASIHLGS